METMCGSSPKDVNNFEECSVNKRTKEVGERIGEPSGQKGWTWPQCEEGGENGR
jgi:hypothetical protein